MRKFIFTAIALCTLQLSVSAEDRPIEVNALPKEAQTFISTHFKDAKVAFATIDKELISTTYEVKFANGDQVEFDSNGKWTEVECKATSVPAAIIPAKVATFVTQKHAEAKILKVEHDRLGYDLKITGGWELKFDNKGNFVRYDD